jgi:hypothetical protein
MTHFRQWQNRHAELMRACKAAEDAEFEAYVRPVRLEVARLWERAATPDPLSDTSPALDLWRQTVLEHGGSPLELAAAWELTAIVCEQDGATHLVAECRANAAQAVGDVP